MFIYIFLCQHTLFRKIFENLQSEFRKLWNFALFANIDLFILVFNVYLHFSGVNTLCFEKFSKICNRSSENFEISLCLHTLVCLFWFPMFIYIFLCQHTLFWKFSKICNRNSENCEISLCLQTLVCLFWFPMFIHNLIIFIYSIFKNHDKSLKHG